MQRNERRRLEEMKVCLFMLVVFPKGHGSGEIEEDGERLENESRKLILSH